jgi:RHS repeat-associated protein
VTLRHRTRGRLSMTGVVCVALVAGVLAPDPATAAPAPARITLTAAFGGAPHQTAARSSGPGGRLYDQNDSDSGVGVSSQNFESSLGTFDSQGADDFSVPSDQSWTIDHVDVTGRYRGGGSGPVQGWTGSEGFGDGNPSGKTCQSFAGELVNTSSGNFSHTFTDFSIAGRGLPLLLSRTYNAGAASQNGPFGYGWASSYTVSLTIQPGTVTVNQEDGSTVTFTASGGVYSAPPRVLATLVRNGDGTFTFTRVQDQTYFTFSSVGQLTQQADPNGYVTSLNYQGGRLSSVTTTDGRSLSFTWTGSTVTKVTDPINRSASFTYLNGNLSSATDVNGGVTTFSYDSNHVMLTVTDPNGGLVSNAYDTNSPPRVTTQTDAMGHVTAFSYGNNVTTITDPNGNVRIDQSQTGCLVAQTMGYGTPQEAMSTFTYDQTLGVASTRDPSGHLWTNTWDGSGNKLSSTDPLGRVTKFTYDTCNDVSSVIDPLKEKTTFIYDARCNLVSMSRPLTRKHKQTTAFTYGDSQHPGDITSVKDPKGNIWPITYDQYGSVHTSSDPLGNVTTYEHNAIGWKLSETKPKGNTTTYAHNAFGDVTTKTDPPPLNDATTYTYDNNDNLVEVVDANNHSTSYGFDLDNKIVSVTRADGTVQTVGYDANHNRTSYTDALGNTTTYGFDPLNRVSAITDPLGRTTTYGYDLAGNLTSVTDPAGNVTSASYDAANHLVGVGYSDGTTPPVSFTYDARGQRTSMTDGTGTTTYVYDRLNRLTLSTNGASSAVSYGYDLNNQVTSLSYPETVKRTYDNAGRLTAVTDWLGYPSKFSYDANGNLVKEVLAGKVVGRRTYDADDRVASIVYNPPAPAVSFIYTRDHVDLLASLQTHGTPQGNETYGYTSLNQVSSVNQATYQYDPGDNLTMSGGAALAYDQANELTSLVNGSGTTAFGYDVRGNRTSQTPPVGATIHYTYDQANRLTAYGAGSTTAQYAYNGDGLRMTKTVNNGAPEAFTWDVAVGKGPALLLKDGTTDYIYGPGGLPLEQVNGNTVLYYLQDQLGSTRALTTSTGTVVATYAYDAYGNVTGTTGSLTNPLQYAGQYSDAESGLIYMQARYYDPSTEQFLTRDPLVTPTKLAYAYVDGDPLNKTDPTGRCWWCDALFIVVLVVAVVVAAVIIVAALVAAPPLFAVLAVLTYIISTVILWVTAPDRYDRWEERNP